MKNRLLFILLLPLVLLPPLALVAQEYSEDDGLAASGPHGVRPGGSGE